MGFVSYFLSQEFVLGEHEESKGETCHTLLHLLTFTLSSFLLAWQVVSRMEKSP